VTKRTRSPNRLKASIVDLTFVIWAIIIPLLFGKRLFSGDGDFARHLRMGEFVLSGGLRQTDAFAHTHTGPFLTTEWLTQVSFALANRVGGLAANAVLAGLIIALAYALIVLYMRRSGVDPMLAYVVGIGAGVLGAPHWLARPHILTFLGLAVLLHLADPVGKRRVWLFAPLFVVWVNFHGGFLLGLMILAAWAAGDLAEVYLAPSGSEQRTQWWARVRFHLAALGIGCAASIVNPMGVGLPLRIVRHLGDSYLLQMTAEFQSPNFHELNGRLLLIAIVAMITALALSRDRPSFPRLTVTLMLLAGALYSKRNIPLFGLVALPLLAVELNVAWQGLRQRWLVHVRRVFEEGERIAVAGRWAPWVAAGLIALALSRGTVAGTQLVTREFDDSVFPVEAVQKARAAGLQGNVFNYFIWGGYMLWAWPEQRIYIDGMTDFLGADVMRSYVKVYYLDPGWEEELSEHDVTVVIFPTDTRVIHELRRRPGWRTWYEDDLTTILTLGEPVLAGGQ